jgi:homocysteine S-methyltransferase
MPVAPLYVTDGGLETELLFHDGLDLPHFAAFPLLETDAGRVRLERYYREYMGIALSADAGFIAESPTWRANRDWGARVGYDTAALSRVNQLAVEWLRDITRGSGIVSVKVSGCIGPRGDGYRPDTCMSAEEARRYHAPQADAFAGAGADMVAALTLTHVAEAVGVAMAASDAGIPVALSFTVEVDGRLPDGTPLGQAIAQVDDATGGGPIWFGVNCAHPTHVRPALRDDAGWTSRIGAIRGNASRMSHAELDNADELDAGDPDDFGATHQPLREALSSVAVVGGCCGTDARHVRAAVENWTVGGPGP